MGIQLGLVHLSGQFGDVQLSIDRNKGRSKLSKPISKERIASADEFINTRRVNKEFEAAAMAVDTLHDCLCGNVPQFGDRFLRARLQGELIAAVRKGQGYFGERNLEVLANLTQMGDFPLCEDTRFKTRFRVHYDLQASPARNSVTLAMPAFNVKGGRIKIPKGADAFRIFICMGLLSDLQYSASDEDYQPLHPDLNGLSVEDSTGWMPTAGTNAGFILVAQLPGMPVVPPTAGLVVSIGIEFCRIVNNFEYPLAAGNAMDILHVF